MVMKEFDIVVMANLENQAILKGSDSIEFTAMMNETKKMLQPRLTLQYFNPSEAQLICDVQKLTNDGLTIREALDKLGSNATQYYNLKNKI